jgi:hypothetical protein
LIIEGDEAFCGDKVTDNEEKAGPQQSKRLLLFSGNDYLGLSSHPTIGNAAAKVWFMIFLFLEVYFCQIRRFCYIYYYFPPSPEPTAITS